MNQYQQILESHTNLVFFSLDKNYCYLAFNQTHANVMEYIWGVKIEEGDNMLDFIHSKIDRKKAKTNFDRAISGESFTLIEEYGDEELHRKHYENYYAPLKNESNVIEGVSIFVTDISNRVQKDQEAIQNETKYRVLFENTVEGILVARLDTKQFIYGNPSVCSMLGYTLAELNGKTLEDIHPVEALQKAKAEFEALAKNKKRVSVILPLMRKDKSTFPVTISTSLVNWDGIQCLVGFISDHTEKMVAKQEIKESEERYRKLFDSSKDAIMTLSPPNWNFIEGNSAILKMFHVENIEEWKTLGPWDVSPNVQPDGELSSIKAKEEIQKALDEGSNFFQWTHQRRNGENFDTTVLLTRVDMVDHHFLQATIRDITQQKDNEEAIRKQTEMQNILMDISSKYINIAIDDVDQSINEALKEIGIFVHADRAYIYKYQLSDKTAHNTHEWNSSKGNKISEEAKKIPLDRIKELVEPHFNGESVFIPDTTDLMINVAKGMRIAQNTKCILTVPLIDNRTCIGFIGFDSIYSFHDYTNREIALMRLFADMLVNMKTRTNEQKNVKNLLETTTTQNKRLKEFSYMTSHNIRASVANMIGLTNMLKSDPGNPKYHNMLEITTGKLDNTISNINELINFESKINELEKTPCNLCDVIQKVLKQSCDIIDQKDAHIKIDIPVSTSVNAFPMYIDNIFHNLVTNAIKYGVTDTSKDVDITASQSDGKVIVEIRDYGLGINLNKHRQKIFRLGTRLHDHSDGQGLGLFMTKRQIEAMDGKIEIDSQVNKGTTFKLYFYE